ncbi:MAG: hypothetical protein O3B99_00055 [Proteobacteria bacterium]|nr:hypothetical protein [Pseudomonadota bacterium]MDA1320670.1 hypothetical protein [Pseudomonadota bacterium]
MAETLEDFLAANVWRPGLPADGSDPFLRNVELIARERAWKERSARAKLAAARKREAKTDGRA